MTRSDATRLLEGRKIVVTGASRGLGRAVALACAREGASVAVCHRTRGDLADEVVREIRERHGGAAVALGFDITNADAVDAAARRAERDLGGLDGWVSAASEIAPGLFVTADPRSVARQIEIALVGPMHCARAAIEIMMRRKYGVLLQVSSVAAVRPSRGQAAYAAAKGGVESLTRALAVEYAKKGVRVLCLRPGPIDTDMLAPTRALAEGEVVGRVPLGRVATAAEVAEHAVFLLSDRAAFATGSVVTVDGGYAVA